MLVVIAIIGTLASVVLASLNSARAKARDANRQSAMVELRKALEIFRIDNGRYPDSTDGDCDYDKSFGNGGCMEALKNTGLFSTLPRDPDSAKQFYYNNWCRVPLGNDNQQYRMWSLGENDHGSTAQNWWRDTDIGFTTCIDPS